MMAAKVGSISPMKKVADHIPGYTFGEKSLPHSPITLAELEELKKSAGLTSEDEHYLRMAGEVLGGQTRQIVDHWRGRIIGGIPNLARHSRDPKGEAIPDYSARSGLRFQQWILDTCLRPYDQAWLDYQQEIALRHTTLKKNQTDAVESTPYVPLRDIIAFIPVMNETIRPYLAAKGHSEDDVRKMHLAWQKSLQFQIALWTQLYLKQAPHEG